jgi:transcriptional regulator with XRE-family HTH domain
LPAPAFGHFNGPKLAQAREAVGISRAQLAKAVGVKPDVVGLWEGRGVTPAAHHLPKVAAAVRLDVFDLYSPPEGVEGLAALRMRAGLSQRRLAQLVGVPQTTLSGWERGTSPLPEGKTEVLAEAFGVNIEEVLAAANAVRPDSPAIGQPQPEKLVTASPGARHHLTSGQGRGGAHLICVADSEIGEHKNSESAPSSISRVYSPQGIDIRANNVLSDEEVRAEGVAQLMAAGIRTWITHHELRVLHNGSPMFSLRRQIAPLDTLKEAVFDKLLEVLTIRGLIEVRGWLRLPVPSGFEDVAPWHAEPFADGAPLIITTPTDHYDWLRDQVEPYAPYRFLLYSKKRDILIVRVGRDHDQIAVGDKQARISDLDIQDDTTLDELVQKFLESV